MATQLFDEVFNASSIYEMLFFNIKSVLEHPTLEDLEEKNKPLYQRWLYLTKTKYNYGQDTSAQTVYEENAIYYPEYCRILAITYANLYMENGQLKREFKKICNEDERLVIETFMTELHLLSSAATKSSPPYFSPLCGHNIISYDIPLLIKRFILLNGGGDDATKRQLPLILRRSLSIKPWESGIVDTVNVWKFNGYDNMPLMLIADFLKLKKSVDLLPLDELSKYYWNNINTDSKETLDFIALQSATQTNLVIQLINELRKL